MPSTPCHASLLPCQLFWTVSSPRTRLVSSPSLGPQKLPRGRCSKLSLSGSVVGAQLQKPARGCHFYPDPLTLCFPPPCSTGVMQTHHQPILGEETSRPYHLFPSLFNQTELKSALELSPERALCSSSESQAGSTGLSPTLCI